jgi:hypothetical protein
MHWTEWMCSERNKNLEDKGRDVFGTDGSYELREDPSHYKQLFEHEKVDLSPENAYYWSNIGKQFNGNGYAINKL